jgi:hypothetical protein
MGVSEKRADHKAVPGTAVEMPDVAGRYCVPACQGEEAEQARIGDKIFLHGCYHTIYISSLSADVQHKDIVN